MHYQGISTSIPNEQRFWNNNLRRRFPRYDELLNQIPSLCTSNADTYLERVNILTNSSDELFEFQQEHAFRDKKFQVRRFSQKALRDLSLRVTQGNRNTCVGIGDWSRVDGILKGSPSAPNQKFKKELKKHCALLVELDEYKTSKCCCTCHARLENARLPKFHYDEEGIIDDVILTRCHQILRCTNGCGIWWNRDVNSSISFYSNVN